MSCRLLILLATTALPLWPGTDPTDYPLRLQIVSAAQTISNGSIFVRGKATLFDPAADTMSAVDYSGSCSFTFQVAPTAAKLMNRAKWKKEGSKLSVLWSHQGSTDKFYKCDFDIYNVLPHRAYITVAGGVELVSEDQLKSQERTKEAMQRDLHPADTDPAHYPLMVSILMADWQGLGGSGKGDVSEGSSVKGIDFAATCAFHPLAGAGNVYRAKWATPEHIRLVILMHEVGEGETRQCELRTNVRPFVYVQNKSTGAIVTMSQDEYRDWHEKKNDTQIKTPQTGSVEPPKKDTSQKLSVSSSPDGADIEVDGAFVGSTPSVIEISVGDHNIMVRKTGYKPWERKLKLTGGDIKVNAELERSTSK